LVPVPPTLTDARVRTAEVLLKNFGAAPLLRGVDRPSKRFVQMMAVGRDADPAIAEFIYELFTETPPAGRGGWARKLVDSLGTNKHIGLQNLTVPTLVIGSERDRLLPMVSSRHIARMAPNLAQFVELSGGHCAILERPDEVNAHLRRLVESVTEPIAGVEELESPELL
jgi:pimeloyl-ACP methyl ester carboxylesterase